MVNHRADANAEVKVGGDAASFQLVAKKRIEKGEEVCIKYGGDAYEYTNDEMLLNYGFVDTSISSLPTSDRKTVASSSTAEVETLSTIESHIGGRQGLVADLQHAQRAQKEGDVRKALVYKYRVARRMAIQRRVRQLSMEKEDM
mmetsp:Transcript_17559/g.43759  ORF Transcript_17559/g.43759 Transcript_17559/m.43759 type:complete len:144 (-) Transcript_17559:307-738(-)